MEIKIDNMVRPCEPGFYIIKHPKMSAPVVARILYIDKKLTLHYSNSGYPLNHADTGILWSDRIDIIIYE